MPERRWGAALPTESWLSTHLCYPSDSSNLLTPVHKRDPMSVSQESGHELCDGGQSFGHSREQCRAGSLFPSNTGRFDLVESPFGRTQTT